MWLAAGPAEPGPARLTPGPAHGPGSDINIKWLATGPAEPGLWARSSARYKDGTRR